MVEVVGGKEGTGPHMQGITQHNTGPNLVVFHGFTAFCAGRLYLECTSVAQHGLTPLPQHMRWLCIKIAVAACS